MADKIVTSDAMPIIEAVLRIHIRRRKELFHEVDAYTADSVRPQGRSKLASWEDLGFRKTTKSSLFAKNNPHSPKSAADCFARVI